MLYGESTASTRSHHYGTERLLLPTSKVLTALQAVAPRRCAGVMLRLGMGRSKLHSCQRRSRSIVISSRSLVRQSVFLDIHGSWPLVSRRNNSLSSTLLHYEVLDATTKLHPLSLDPRSMHPPPRHPHPNLPHYPTPISFYEGTHCIMNIDCYRGLYQLNCSHRLCIYDIPKEGSIYLSTYPTARQGMVIAEELGLRGLLQACYQSRCVALDTSKKRVEGGVGGSAGQLGRKGAGDLAQQGRLYEDEGG